MNPKREGKKLLVLDIDYTLFDHRQTIFNKFSCDFKWYHIVSSLQVCSRGWLGAYAALPPRVPGSSLRALRYLHMVRFWMWLLILKYLKISGNIASDCSGQQQTWNGLKRRWSYWAATRIPTTSSPSIWTPEQWSRFRQRSMELWTWSLWELSGVNTLSMTKSPPSCSTTCDETFSWTLNRDSKSGRSGSPRKNSTYNQFIERLIRTEEQIGSWLGWPSISHSLPSWMISHTSGDLQRHFTAKHLAPHQKLFSGTVGGRDTTRSTVNIEYRVLSTLQQLVQYAVSNMKMADLVICWLGRLCRSHFAHSWTCGQSSQCCTLNLWFRAKWKP